MNKINKQNSDLIRVNFFSDLLSLIQTWWKQKFCKYVSLKLDTKWEALKTNVTEFLYETKSWVCFRVTGCRKRIVFFSNFISEHFRSKYYNLINRLKELFVYKIRFPQENSQNNKSQKGFTLVELLIAITIFVGFLVVVANSYISIIRAQKSANETRQMYSEMRNFVDFVNNQMREGTIDYFCYQTNFTQIDASANELVRCAAKSNLQIGAGDNLRIISKDGLSATTIVFDNSQIKFFQYKKEDDVWLPVTVVGNADNSTNGDGQIFGFSTLAVKNLYFDIYPKTDPAVIKTGDLSNQIQPMVLMTVQVASVNPSINFNLNFQTMLTSRSQ